MRHVWFVLLFGLILSQRVSAQEEVTVNFTVYRDEESLTMLFLGFESIPFHSIRIDVYVSDEEVTEIYLQNYSTFRRALQRDALQPPTCLRIQLRDSEMPFPSDCRLLLSQQRRVEDNLGRIDIFWHDDEINEYFDLEFFQGDTLIGVCPADQVEDEVCEITFTPQPMPIVPTITPRPTAIFAPAQPTAAPTVIVGGYPCSARVDPTSAGTRLNVIRQFPVSSASIIASVPRGETVIILERSAGNGDFYRIQANGQTLGWIPTQHLLLSPTCP